MKNKTNYFKAKIIIVSFMVTLSSFYACKKLGGFGDENRSVNPVISKFLNSKDFKKNLTFFQTFGEVKIEEIKIDSVVHLNKVYHVLYIPLYSNNILKAGLQVVDLLDTKRLPNGDTYAMNLEDMRDYNITSRTGRVKMIDINYDRFEHSVVVVKNNLIQKWQSNTISKLMDNKYHSLKNVSKGTAPERLATAIPCDDNRDGNLGFFECYKCISDAIDDDGFSQFVCAIPIAGWVSCWGSTTAACIVLSSVY